MSEKTRKKNEAEDCHGEKRVVMSGGTSRGSKIFIILPFVFLKIIVSISEATNTDRKHDRTEESGLGGDN